MTEQKHSKKVGGVNALERVGVQRRYCRDCEESTVHETGSQLWLSCRFQKGWRSINSVCNLPNQERTP